MRIKNCPSEAWNYEFIVVNRIENEYEYVTHTTDGFLADSLANDLKNGVVVHNVRIQGKKRD